MKTNHLFSFAMIGALALSLASLSSCSKEPKQEGGNQQSDQVVLTKQSEVDAFQTVKSLTSLTIQGTDVTNIDNINVTTVGTLIIKGTGIEEINNPTFTSVNTALEITDNASLKSISGLGLKFATADILIQNNTVLDCIKGFLNLKKMSGKFTIKDNPALGEDDASKGREWGFNVLKELVDNQIMTNAQITLSNNHPNAVTDPSMIGCGTGGVPSYTIRNAADLKQITKTECQDLTLLGSDVDDQVWADIKTTGLTVVHGNLLCDGCNFKMCANFFEKNGDGVKVEGSITMKNFVAYQQGLVDADHFLNADNVPAHVGGDIYLEKMVLHGWSGAGWNNVTEVDGSVTVRECAMDPGVIGAKMDKIHGNLVLDNLKPGLNSGTKGPWNMNQSNFKEIDGSLIITNNDWFTSLDGFQNITKIGDSLIIKNNFAAGKAGGESCGLVLGGGALSYDLVQQWIFDGVVDPAKVECYDVDGNLIKFKTEAPLDLTITKQADIDALKTVDGGLVAKSLTVSGADVTDQVFANIKTKVSSVTGPVVIDGCNVTILSNFFKNAQGEGVECEGDITFKNITGGAQGFLNSDGFPKAPKGNVTIEGCTLHGWGEAGFNGVVAIPGNLVIKNCKMAGVAAFTHLKTVTGDLTLDGIAADWQGNRVWNADQWIIETVGGKLTIQNTQYVNFQGFEKIKKIGSLYVKANPIPAATFSTVQQWIYSELVPFNAVECYDDAGTKVTFKEKPSDYPDYATVVKGHDAIVEFAKLERKDYRYLVIDGNNENVSDSEMANLKASVKAVSERLIFKDIKSWTMVEQVILPGDFSVEPTGSLEIINCPNVNNINGLKRLTVVNGDLIIKDVPLAPFNWGAGNCLNNITEIKGDFTLDNTAATNLTGATCLASLTKVGGNLTITNINTGFWDLDGMPLKEIGGNFIYKDNKLVNSFKGFLGLTKIGGKLEVSGTAIGDFSQVQTWINNKVVAKENVTCIDSKGNAVTFE
ncbi:MAG: hypothetical protein MJY62_01365 [Bacteroidales bacterium]|nr:hypothetical protein [Bacteroidales bacterium]